MRISPTLTRSPLTGPAHYSAQGARPLCRREQFIPLPATFRASAIRSVHPIISEISEMSERHEPASPHRLLRAPFRRNGLALGHQPHRRPDLCAALSLAEAP